jgi:serine O-acetyltransferase
MSKIVYYLYALASTLSKANIPFLPKIIQIIIRLVFGCYIPYTAQIGKNTVLGYGGLGIVIHARCVIGENCVIGPGVTLGGTSHKYEVPKLGNSI